MKDAKTIFALKKITSDRSSAHTIKSEIEPENIDSQNLEMAIFIHSIEKANLEIAKNSESVLRRKICNFLTGGKIKKVKIEVGPFVVIAEQGVTIKVDQKIFLAMYKDLSENERDCFVPKHEFKKTPFNKHFKEGSPDNIDLILTEEKSMPTLKIERIIEE